MKIGIIVIFRNNVDEIDVEAISKNLSFLGDVVVCLVDNKSTDGTLKKLKEIRDNLKNVELIEIKKKSSLETSKRAGARFMYSNYNLDHLGFIDSDSVNSENLNINEVISLVFNSKDVILGLKKELKQQPAKRYTLFKSIFSVLDFLKQNHLKTSFDNILLSAS